MNTPPGLITRQREPANLEMPFSSLEGFQTPKEQFYVRSHFEAPTLEAKTWSVAVSGAVDHPFTLSLDDLKALPTKTVASTMECSGNGRTFIESPQVGIRWEMGAVGTAEWTGVALSVVLEKAGIRADAVEVILEGHDSGEFKPPLSKSPGEIPYARSLPRKKALAPEVLLAFRMNGAELPPRHGYPVRVVVPGWYGMASIKWLKRIIVTDRPFHGFFQTTEYGIWERRDGLPTLVPVAEIPIKSQIARPAPHEVVPPKTAYRVHGAAWAGEGEVVRVEVSDDGGQSWNDASLLGQSTPFAWRLWEFLWTSPEKTGPKTLMARATDARGMVQPRERDTDRQDNMINHIFPIPIEVR